MKRILLAGLALGICFATMAEGRGPGAVRKQVEASMLLTGSITVDEQGKVASHEIDKPEKVGRELLDFVNSNVASWQFQPVLVDGKPVSARNKWSLRLVAKKQPDDPKQLSVRISGVSFEPYEFEKGSEIAASDNGLTPPKYPMVAARSGVSGSVYLVVKVGRDGLVEDVMAEQVNMRFVASEGEMEKWRDVLSKAAMTQAQRWRFTLPDKGKSVNDPFWLVRVPVDFNLGDGRRNHGQWEVYVPGPRQSAPWREATEAPGFSPDAMVSGISHMVGREGGLKLLTPLGG